MSLSYSQYQSIMRSYDARRMEAGRIRDSHLEEVRNAIPEYSDLEDKAVSIAMSYGKRLLSDTNGSLSDMDSELKSVTEAKRRLLAAHGYDPDYTEIHYSCPDCRDTGYIDNAKCHCFRQAEINLIYSQSNIQDFFKNNNFDQLKYDLNQGEDQEHFRKAVDICHTFVNDFRSGSHSLMLYGTVGTGKSFLSGCIAYDLLCDGCSVIYFSAPDLFTQLSASTFRKGAPAQDDDTLENIYDCDLLIIDDLGTELASSFVNSSLFTCLNERQLRGRSTIISTNLTLEDLHKRYSDRVFSRIIGRFDIVKLTGPDLRVKYKDINN